MSSYSDKLDNPRWQRKRLEIMQRDGFSCFACGSAEKKLNVHHVLYHGEPWQAKDCHLQTLCVDCHKKLDGHKMGGIGYVRSFEGIGMGVWHCGDCGSYNIEFHSGGAWCKCGWSATNNWTDLAFFDHMEKFASIFMGER